MYSKRINRCEIAHCWMQTHSHRWSSTKIPSGSSQDFVGSSQSVTWPHYVSPNGVTTKHHVRLSPRVSHALHVQGLSGAQQGTFFLPFTAYFHVLPRVHFPSSSASAHFARGCRGMDYTPASLPTGSSPPAGQRQGPGRFLGGRKWFNSGKLQQQIPSALKQLSSTSHWLQRLPA